MAIARIVASLAECIFTITKIEDYVPWIKDEIMPTVKHVVAKIESDKLGENGLPLYTQVGFFITADKEEKFEKLLNKPSGLPQSPLRPLLYNTGRGHRNVQVEVSSRATIEIIFGGNDPLAGLDYYFEPNKRITNRGGWSAPESNAHAGNTEVGEDEEITIIPW
jgi:hypothetical protein